MDEKSRELALGAMLHDIGKLIQRAMPGRGTHSEIGADYLKKINGNDKWKELFNCVEYHHSSALKNAGLSRESFAYIVCEADNIAAGVDRRKINEEDAAMFDKYTPLHSLFNIFNYVDTDDTMAYSLKTMDESFKINFPENIERKGLSDTSVYYHIYNSFDQNFKNMDWENDSLDSFLKLLETHLAYVPSSTNIAEVPDISMYNHLKMTAAVSGCLYSYFNEKEISDYRKACFEEVGLLRKTELFLLVSGEFSGIQNFIYTISSKGALKLLRGRSFYLELMAEHIIDDMLNKAGFSRANLIYSGGGHFYLLLPNTGAMHRLLNDAKKSINEWLLLNYGTNLYFEMAWTEASPDQLCNNLDQVKKSQNLTGALFKKISEKASGRKLQRYDRQQLIDLMTADSGYNNMHFTDRECSVCGSSGARLENVRGETEEGRQMCAACYALYKMGDRLPRLDRTDDRNMQVITILNPDQNNEGIELPSLDGKVLLDFQDVQKAKQGIISGSNRRVYSVNKYMSGINYSTNLWAGIYSAEDPEKRGLIDFEALVNKCWGIKRLGVLRADVDNLGQAFISGFEKKDGSPDKYQFVSLSRYASLSYNLSMFFKFEINKLCAGNAGIPQYRLESCKYDEETGPRQLVIVYSGGDDLFVVGAWNEVLGFAVDLHRAFSRFTNGKMTMSAGFGMFDHKFPIAQMAKITGDLEKCAKENPEKDSIALFGMEFVNGRTANRHTYKWDRLENKVLNEKLASLYKWFDVINGSDDEEKSRGLTKIYNLLTLYNSIYDEKKENKKINVARLAYMLGRMEPDGRKKDSQLPIYKEMRDAMYAWALNYGDRQELLTALYILIYLYRKEDN